MSAYCGEFFLHKVNVLREFCEKIKGKPLAEAKHNVRYDLTNDKKHTDT